MNVNRILESVERYYTRQVETHGPTARGVDWNSAESQSLRFEQLLKICSPAMPISINDYGCGYGALADHLQEQGYSFRYCGFDISSRMMDKAEELHSAMSNVTFVGEESGLTNADYTVASGIFNVKLETPATEWVRYVLNTLGAINRISNQGFSFNLLTKYSDPEFMRPNLYYADPLFFFDYCKANYSRFVTLLHDYPLYEFTILVRKTG